MSRYIRVAISEIVLRVALLVLAAPVLPVADEIGGLFRHISNGLEQVPGLR